MSIRDKACWLVVYLEAVDRDEDKRQSVTLADRIRRGMSGEMAADLQALIVRAKPVVAKSQATLENKPVDLTQVLSLFVQERVMMG